MTVLGNKTVLLKHFIILSKPYLQPTKQVTVKQYRCFKHLSTSCPEGQSDISCPICLATLKCTKAHRLPVVCHFKIELTGVGCCFQKLIV